MRRIAALALAALALLGAAAWYLLGTRSGQDMALAALVPRLVDRAPVAEYDGLRVFLCGTASPLVAPGHAQACVAVLAGEDLYLVDAGMGAAGTFAFSGESLVPLRAVLLTHFHSDHITGLPDVNLNSWVAGRRQPLQVVGPLGVGRVVAGFNEAFALDYGYRVAHHGAAMLPLELAVLEARTMAAGVVLDQGGLVVTAFPVDHAPVAPAFGYRFDYRGRSVVVSGDTLVTDSLRTAAQGADLLLHDALSLPIVRALEEGARAAGQLRLAKIMADIPSYHAHAAQLGELAASAGVRQLALYHFVPVPRNLLMRQVFRRDLPANAMLAEDGLVVELPGGSSAIDVHWP